MKIQSSGKAYVDSGRVLVCGALPVASGSDYLQTPGAMPNKATRQAQTSTNVLFSASPPECYLRTASSTPTSSVSETTTGCSPSSRAAGFTSSSPYSPATAQQLIAVRPPARIHYKQGTNTVHPQLIVACIPCHGQPYYLRATFRAPIHGKCP